MTVVTGISGSGKTSLVFDTLYQELRRRLQDVISTSRPGGWQHQLPKANVESITGLGPAIAIDQNILNRNPLSTLATASGLHPFLRLLYAHFSVRHCPECGHSLSVFTADEIVERLLAEARKEPFQVFAPLMRVVMGVHHSLLKALSVHFPHEKLWVDGAPWDGALLDSTVPHDLDVNLGSLDNISSIIQIREVVSQVAAMGAQALSLRSSEHSLIFASAPVCVGCGAWFSELEPKHFHLPCPYCQGDGCQSCSHTGMHPLAAGASWGGQLLPELLERPVSELLDIFSQAELPGTAARLVNEIMRRLQALDRCRFRLSGPRPRLSQPVARRITARATGDLSHQRFGRYFACSG